MTVLSDLEKLSAAEDFFAYLQVSHDPSLLRFARLHILKRMGKYLAEQNFDGVSEEAIFAETRKTLERAYADFTVSRPIDERVFKVLQEHDPSLAAAEKPHEKPFVPLAALAVETGQA
jgi:hypothetical protein